MQIYPINNKISNPYITEKSVKSNQFVIFGTHNSDVIAKAKLNKSVDYNKLFENLTKSAKENITGQYNLFKMFGLKLDEYIPIAIKGHVYSHKQETIDSVFRKFLAKFSKYGLSSKKHLSMCLKSPQLFYQSPDTIEKNVFDLVSKFEKEGLTVEQYIHACLKQPTLFYREPESIEKNVRELVRKFEKEGLSTEQYLLACLKRPSLFYQSPETIEKNVRDLVSRFDNEGLTTEKYISVCLNQAQLFYQSPDTIEKNVRNAVSRFEKEGLTMEKFLPACVKQSSLFYRSPESIENNLRRLVSCFEKEGLTSEKYVSACLKEQTLFCSSPETITEHIKAFMFAAKNNNNYDANTIMDSVLRKKLTLSTSLIYLHEIIRPQLKKQSQDFSDMKCSGIKPYLKKYFEKHSDAKFKIEIIDDKMTEHFIKTMQEYCQKEYGRYDMFQYEIKSQR